MDIALPAMPVSMPMTRKPTSSTAQTSEKVSGLNEMPKLNREASLLYTQAMMP